MNQEEEKPKALPERRRPFLLTVFCLFSIIYILVFFLLFLFGFLYSDWVSQAINRYLPGEGYNPNIIRVYLGLFTLLLVVALVGILGMWNMRKYGYYLFGISSLSVCVMQLANPQFAFTGIIIFVILIVLFGLYFRRFR